MSSTLRLSIIMVLLLATAAFGLISYRMTLPKAEPTAEQPVPPPSPVVYFVAKHPLTEGVTVHDEDLRSMPLTEAPPGAVRATSGDMRKLRGSLVRKYVYAGDAITAQDVMLRSDPGFRAALEKVCHDANTRQETTVTVFRGGQESKLTSYSVRKIDAKASEACAELDAMHEPPPA